GAELPPAPRRRPGGHRRRAVGSAAATGMSAGPAVSIVMPALNAATFIGAAIATVRLQDLDDYELLVVDNGSTDGTRRVVAALAAADGRIRLMEAARPGPAA